MKNYLAAFLLLLALGPVGDCFGQATSTPPSPSEKTPLISRLSVERVKEIASARIRTNGFPVKASDPWSIALQINEKGYTWAAHLLLPDVPSPFLIYVDDATGNAEFLTPVIHGEQKLPAGADWLVKISDALTQTRFPIELETLMRTTHFAGAKATGGGVKANRALFLEYTIRDEDDAPARFEIRCYYSQNHMPSSPKMITAVELAYVDAKLNRYRLVRDPD
jgi:hypothetical protein